MFDLAKKLVHYHNPEGQPITESIDHFEVWFATPFGITEDLDYAVRQCLANDLNPAFSIQSKSVAVTTSGYYEVLP